MDYMTIFWTCSMLLVSSSTLSEAHLPAYFQNGVEVRHVHLTKNYDIPGDPIGSLPNVYNFTGSPARLFLCIDTRMQSFALVRDNESESLLMFYTTQMQFNFTFANNIEFDIVNNQGRLTLFCTFPSIDYAKLFFQLVRGSNSDYEPEELLVMAIEYYDETRNHRESIIQQPTFLRQNFVGDRMRADLVEFEFKWERPATFQPVSIKFTPRNFEISNVINRKVAMTVPIGDGGKYYVLYFALPKTAQDFFTYMRQFARETVKVTDTLRNFLCTAQQLK